MYDFSGGRVKRLLSLHCEHAVTSAAPHISAHTAFLLTGSHSGEVSVWQVDNGSLVTSLRDAAALGSATSSLCWETGASEDVSRLFAGSDTGSIKLWDLDQGAVVGTFKGHKAAPTSLCNSVHNGTLASGSQDTTVKLWDPRAPREAAATLKGQGGAITQVKHSPDGSLVVSGSEEGAIKVWDTRSARVLMELKNHTKRVHSLAFHPEERLLVSASADRTVHFWDLGTAAQCDKAGPLAKETRVLAFPSDGRALLAAAADGLRTLTWEPCRNPDTVEVPWSKVSSLCYFDGKAFGLAFAHSTVDMWTVDLTQVQPFGQPPRPASCPIRRRLSIQEAIVQGAAMMQSSESLRRPSTGAGVQAHRPPQLPPGPGPAAQFVAERRHQLQQQAPKPRGMPTAAGLEVFTAPGLKSVPAQRNSPTRTLPPPAAYPSQLHPCASSSSTCSLGSECSTPCSGQHSAAENLLFSDASTHKAGRVSDAGGCGGLEAADRVLVGHAGVRTCLRERAGRLKEIRSLLARGDVRGTVHAIKAYQDLAITMQVVSKWAVMPDPPLELCIEAAGLCDALLSSPEPVNQDAGLQMVACVLQRWGSFIRGALSAQFARQGVDVEYESRRERCTRCKEQLQRLLPALGKCTGNPKAQHLSSQIVEL